MVELSYIYFAPEQLAVGFLPKGTFDRSFTTTASDYHPAQFFSKTTRPSLLRQRPIHFWRAAQTHAGRCIRDGAPVLF
jgi:hypothetical protein